MRISTAQLSSDELPPRGALYHATPQTLGTPRAELISDAVAPWASRRARPLEFSITAVAVAKIADSEPIDQLAAVDKAEADWDHCRRRTRWARRHPEPRPSSRPTRGCPRRSRVDSAAEPRSEKAESFRVCAMNGPSQSSRRQGSFQPSQPTIRTSVCAMLRRARWSRLRS
jgi:hypothetical protein